MPELPEVHTIATQLNGVLVGKIFSSVEVLREKSAQSDLSKLVGRKIKRVRRLAKMIMFEMENMEKVLLVHLKMTGQLIYQKQEVRSKNQEKKQKENMMANRIVGGHPTKDWVSKLPSSHTRIMAKFDDESTLYFNDQRVFGWWKLLNNSELKAKMLKLPPDVVSDRFTIDYFKDVLSRSRRAIKLVILDQQKMGGMGNIYANDALWMAGVDPKKPANELISDQIKTLYDEMVKVLHEGIELGGASISDYVHVSGSGGGYQNVMRVYEGVGEDCKRDDCDGVIEKIKLGGRGTYFCAECQK